MDEGASTGPMLVDLTTEAPEESLRPVDPRIPASQPSTSTGRDAQGDLIMGEVTAGPSEPVVLLPLWELAGYHSHASDAVIAEWDDIWGQIEEKPRLQSIRGGLMSQEIGAYGRDPGYWLMQGYESDMSEGLGPDLAGLPADALVSPHY